MRPFHAKSHAQNAYVQYLPQQRRTMSQSGYRPVFHHPTVMPRRSHHINRVFRQCPRLQQVVFETVVHGHSNKTLGTIYSQQVNQTRPDPTTSLSHQLSTPFVPQDNPYEMTDYSYDDVQQSTPDPDRNSTWGLEDYTSTGHMAGSDIVVPSGDGYCPWLTDPSVRAGGYSVIHSNHYVPRTDGYSDMVPGSNVYKHSYLFHQRSGQTRPQSNSVYRGEVGNVAHQETEYVTGTSQQEITVTDQFYSKQMKDFLDLLDKPTKHDVLILLVSIDASWRDIGNGLGLCFNYLEGLEQSPMCNKTKLDHVLQRWIDKDSLVTWKMIIDVVRGPLIQNNTLAKKIFQYLKQEFSKQQKATDLETKELTRHEETDFLDRNAQQEAEGDDNKIDEKNIETELCDKYNESDDDKAKNIQHLLLQELDRFNDSLCRTLDQSLPKFAILMLEQNFISDYVHDNNQTFDAIMYELKVGLEWLDIDELREYCTSFLSVLHNVGGPSSKAAHHLKLKWNKAISNKYNMTFLPDQRSQSEPCIKPSPSCVINQSQSDGQFPRCTRTHTTLQALKQLKEEKTNFHLADSSHETDDLNDRINVYPTSHHSCNSSSLNTTRGGLYHRGHSSGTNLLSLTIPEETTNDDFSTVNTRDEIVTNTLTLPVTLSPKFEHLQN